MEEALQLQEEEVKPEIYCTFVSTSSTDWINCQSTNC